MSAAMNIPHEPIEVMYFMQSQVIKQYLRMQSVSAVELLIWSTFNSYNNYKTDFGFRANCIPS